MTSFHVGKVVRSLPQAQIECFQSDGYSHAERPETDSDGIANPVARKALGEALKQVNAVIRAYGKPTHIHVELARDVGKSLEDRPVLAPGRWLVHERHHDQPTGGRRPDDGGAASPMPCCTTPIAAASTPETTPNACWLTMASNVP